MSMKDDDRYLWDASGPPDEEIVRLEQALRPLRHVPADPPLSVARVAMAPVEPAAGTSRRRRWGRRALLVGGGSSALAAAAAAALWWRRRGGAADQAAAGEGTVASEGSPWTVAPLAGAPRLGNRELAAPREAGSGAVLETDAGSRARISMGSIGQVEIDGHTRVRLLAAGAEAHRLGLERGVMHALIWAPPGKFQVETAVGVVTDLGCSYTLAVDESGRGRVTVTSGWVGFDYRGRESLIPAGSTATLAPGAGPGTPAFPDGSPRLRALVAAVDARGTAGPVELSGALATARPVDALPLWHLLGRVPPAARGEVHDRLASLVPPPAAVTRAGIVAGDARMRDAWWDALGFGPISDWRRWKAASAPTLR
jgi:hypothetical protein